MTYYVRRMYQEDVTQVTEIDREAFPTQWPPPNYRRELDSRLSHYIVVCDEDIPIEQPDAINPIEKDFSRPGSIWANIFKRRNSSSRQQLPPSMRHCIVGFSGFWFLAEEAHISSIAVRETYRRLGIGELLLISIISMAADLKARVVTLEVRTSNTTAQKLYEKYGFVRAGVRHAYYNDNREDGLIMTTEDITSAAFKANLREQKQSLSSKLGIDRYQITR